MRVKRKKKIHHYRGVERAAQRRARNRSRNMIIGIKMMFGCFRCLETNPAVLAFHHRDPNKKEFGISKAVGERAPLKKVIFEISKCDILCANCHLKEHHNQFSDLKESNFSFIHIVKIDITQEQFSYAISGKLTAHTRWHASRGIVKEGCELCEAKEQV